MQPISDKKIIFCKWNGCAEYGMQKAFESMGYEVESVTYAFNGADYSGECLELLGKAFDCNKYEFAFSQNYIPIVGRVCKIYKIPYISWVMDSPAYHLYSDSIKSPYNYIFIFDRMLYEQFEGDNPGHIFYQPLATCVDIWDATKMDGSTYGKYDADVSFVGSMYIKECHYDEVNDLPVYLKGYLDGLIEAQLNVYGYNFLEDVLDEAKAIEFAEYAKWTQADDYRHDYKGVVAGIYLGQKCAQLERLRIADLLMTSGYDFKLYTNSPLSEKYDRINQGVVGYYNEMPLVFRGSKINLNITSKSIRSGLPLRMFDIMGAGGFCITNYQTELPNFFEIGKDIAVYESIPHLKELIDYYLKHEDERIEITRNGYEKVKKYHTYDVALRRMIGTVLR